MRNQSRSRSTVSFIVHLICEFYLIFFHFLTASFLFNKSKSQKNFENSTYDEGENLIGDKSLNNVDLSNAKTGCKPAGLSRNGSFKTKKIPRPVESKNKNAVKNKKSAKMKNKELSQSCLTNFFRSNLVARYVKSLHNVNIMHIYFLKNIPTVNRHEKVLNAILRRFFKN